MRTIVDFFIIGAGINVMRVNVTGATGAGAVLVAREKRRGVLCAAQMETRKKITGKGQPRMEFKLNISPPHANPNNHPFDGDSALCVLLGQSCSFQVVRRGRYCTVERIPLGLASSLLELTE